MALRKLLGSADHSAVRRLMRLIETQSCRTLVQWAAEDTAAHMLPLVPDEPRLSDAISAALAFASGQGTLADAKRAVRDARAAAQSLVKDPVRQAAARAIATACATVATPTCALGFTFYSAAAFAYHTAGTSAAPHVHDELATQELERLADALQAASVPDEPCPVRIEWGC